MLNTSVYPEKWQRMLTIVSKYPVIDFSRQYKYLVVKRLIAANIFTFLLQYISLMISTLLPMPSPVWFATGTASAIVFLRGYRVSTGIWLGGFTAYYLASHQFVLSCACSIVFVVQAILLTWMTRRYINPSLVFYHAHGLRKFSLYSGILTAISSFILIWICREPYSLWLQWWLANFNGLLIIAIALVSADTFFTNDKESLGSHVWWPVIARWSLIITLFIGMLFYLNLLWIMSITLPAMLVLQLILGVGTLSGLFLSLNKK